MGLPGTVWLRREGEREARASKDSPEGLPLEALAGHALFAASRGTLLCLGFGLCTLFFFLALLAQAGRAVADVRYTSAIRLATGGSGRSRSAASSTLMRCASTSSASAISFGPKLRFTRRRAKAQRSRIGQVGGPPRD
jgi:hypothetical protein